MKKIRILLVGLIFVTGFLLRFYGVGVESFSVEEAVNFSIITQPDVVSVYEKVIEQKGAQPCFYLMGHFWAKLLPPTEKWLRLLSVIAGSLVLLVVYFLARNFLSVGVSLGVTCFACFSDYLIDISRGFTYQAVLLLFICVNAMVFFRMNRKPVGRFFVWLFILSGALAVNTHSVAWGYLIVQFLLTSFFHVDKTCLSFKRYLSYFAVILMFSIQNIIITFSRLFDIVCVHTTLVCESFCANFLLRILFGGGIRFLDRFWILGIIFVTGFFCYLFFVIAFRKRFFGFFLKNRYLLYCVWFCVGQTGFALIGSYLSCGFFCGRGAILSVVIFIYIIVCAGIFCLKRTKYFVLAGLIFINIFSSGYSISPDFKSAAEWIGKDVGRDDIIVCFDLGTAQILNCYGLEKKRKIYLSPKISPNQLYEILKNSGENIWVVSVHNRSEELFMKGYRCIKSLKKTGDRFICVYNYRLIK